MVKKSCKKYQYKYKKSNKCRNYAWFKNKSTKEQGKIRKSSRYCGKGRSVVRGKCKRKSKPKSKRKSKPKSKPKRKSKRKSKPKSKPPKRKTKTKGKRKLPSCKYGPRLKNGKCPKKRKENFTIIKMLGAGGFGKVYAAMLEDGTKFALKVQNVPNTRIKKIIDNEIKILKELGCTQYTACILIPELTKYNAKTKRYTIAMQLAGTRDLHHYIYNEPRKISWPQYQMIRKHLIDGLKYIHSKGMAHLDIKPSNIMIDDNNVPKFIDFGLTCKTRLCDYLGTPGYMGKDHYQAWTTQTKLDFENAIKSDYFALQRTLCQLREDKLNVVKPNTSCAFGVEPQNLAEIDMN